MGKKILTEAGYEVVAVSNGAAAVKKIAEQKPDIIILDVYMPGYSGLDVLSGLHCLGSRLPVIVITAFGDSATHQLAFSFGAKAVFDKPFPIDDLRLKVAQLLGE